MDLQHDSWLSPPYVFAVLDDEDSSNITAGSIVTVTVTLTRKRMAASIQSINPQTSKRYISLVNR